MTQTARPVALCLTRQNLPTLDRTRYAPAAGVQRGGYVLGDCPGTPDVILIGTGSELQFAVAAGEKLAAEGVAVRVVSLPSFELFDEQPAEYRESVLPAAVRKRVAIEAGVTLGWQKYVGLDGAVIGRDAFGASAPYSELYREFGLTADNVYATAKRLLG